MIKRLLTRTSLTVTYQFVRSIYKILQSQSKSVINRHILKMNVFENNIPNKKHNEVTLEELNVLALICIPPPPMWC
jgi:hypothetical protein